MKRSILVVGAFGYESNQLDGQTIKTRNVYDMIKKRCNCDTSYVDTLYLKKRPWLLFNLLYKLCICRTLVLLPAHNNLTYLFPILYFLSKILRYDINCICIGGWQVEFFMGTGKFGYHPHIMSLCKKVKVFMPEMEQLNNELKNICKFNNTVVFPNFRTFDRAPLSISPHKGFRMVFLARVNKHKGYDVIFNSLPYLRKNCPDCIIDFYGQIASDDKEEFEQLVNSNNDIVSYKGILNQESITATLKGYDVMLLPTHYYTEGFPGSILDAYIAGIPVIVSEWKHAHEFVKNSITGIIVPFEDNQDAFNETILALYNDQNLLNRMKVKAFEEADKYSEDAAWSILNKYL